MVLTRLGQPAEAVTDFRKVVELDSRSPEAHLNLGIALADQFDLQSALKEFTEAVELAPDAPVPHYNRRSALVDVQRNPEAQPELETATRLDPKLADAWYVLGIIAKQSCETQKSDDLFGKAVTVDPNNAADPSVSWLASDRRQEQLSLGSESNNAYVRIGPLCGQVDLELAL